MGKVKALKHNANKGKQQLHEIKGGSIKKNKDSKFKNTPKDQKPPNKNKVSKKYLDQKSSPNGNAVAKRSKQDSPNKKQNFKQNTNSNKAQRIGKKTFNPKKVEKQLDKSNSNTIESEDDSLNKSDETSESDSDIPDILGKSLGDETDDEDYEEEEEEDTDNDDDSDEEEIDDDDDSDEEEMSEHKGVKMFKGLQSKNKKNQKEDDEIESNENTTESDEDDDEDDTDEDDDKEKQKKKDDHIKKPKIRIIKNYAEVDPIVSENSDSDDYSNDTTDYSDDDDAELGTKALLGQSIADDDDENFNGEDKDSSDDMYEDDISSEIEKDSENDENDAEREANENENSIIGRFNITQKEKDDLARRIVLIDNISKTTPSNEIAELCKEYGKYQIFEARPYPAFFLDSEKGEQIEPLEWLNRDYPHLETFSVNVLYSNRQDALKAMKHMHGMKFAGNYLNVVTADQTVQEPDYAVYITNLKKTMPDNYIWKMFNQCGTIVRMRNVRDPITGLSRGFGYISFNNVDSAKFALEYNNVKLNGRRIKVLPYPYREKTSVKNLVEEIRRRNQTILESGKRILENDNRSSKKFKKSSGEPANVEPERNIKKHKKQEGDKKKSTAFQGQMVELKNKNKKNKLDKKKKKMAEKLVAKSKKTKKN
ncbi:PREDICTED: nucleolin-like [Atta cephalotes]|uniref:RRM domain-containing protein n=1 Tax=Atta cephalotes TaxID=12957 RepID=A0A158NP66_ATTCE|nr:PREDICTED: nucleolin-like [Atta cephalotes]